MLLWIRRTLRSPFAIRVQSISLAARFLHC